MEKYIVNIWFCIIVNYFYKFSLVLLFWCIRFWFSFLKEWDIRVLVDKVIDEEYIKIKFEVVDVLVKFSKGDMR